MEYMTVSQAAELWGLSARRIRFLCSEGRIPDVVLKGNRYMIPADTERPVDGRRLRRVSKSSHYAALFSSIDGKKAKLDQCRPLTEGEVRRLRDEFTVDYTYNSNAIEGNTLTLKETAMVLEGMTIDRKPLKDHLEAAGHRDAFAYVEELAQHKTRLRDIEIKTIHSLVLIDRPSDKGVYRRIPVHIMGACTEPAQPHLIDEKMTELLLTNEKRKKTMHPIERIARFHLELKASTPLSAETAEPGDCSSIWS